MILFALGVIIGIVLTVIFRPKVKASGTFIIDSSDPEENTPRLEFDEDLNSMYSKKRIVLNIRTCSTPK